MSAFPPPPEIHIFNVWFSYQFSFVYLLIYLYVCESA